MTLVERLRELHNTYAQDCQERALLAEVMRHLEHGEFIIVEAIRGTNHRLDRIERLLRNPPTGLSEDDKAGLAAGLAQLETTNAALSALRASTETEQ